MNIQGLEVIQPGQWGKLVSDSSSSVSCVCHANRRYIVIKNGKYQLATRAEFDTTTKKLSLDEITQISKCCIEKTFPTEHAVLGKQIIDCTNILIEMRQKKWDSYRLGRIILIVFSVLLSPVLIGIFSGIFLGVYSKREQVRLAKLKNEMNKLETEVASSKEKALCQLPPEAAKLEGWSDDEKLKLQTFRNLALSQTTDLEQARVGIEEQINKHSNNLKSIHESIRGKTLESFNTQFYLDVARSANFIRKDESLGIKDSEAVPAKISIQAIDNEGNYAKEDVERVVSYLDQEEFDKLSSKDYPEVIKAQRVLNGAKYINQLIQSQDNSSWKYILEFVITQVTKADIISSSTLLFMQVFSSDGMGIQKVDSSTGQEYSLAIDVYREAPTCLEIIRDPEKQYIKKVIVKTDGYLALLKKFVSLEAAPLLPEALKFHTQYSVTLGEDNKAIVSDPIFNFEWANLAQPAA